MTFYDNPGQLDSGGGARSAVIGDDGVATSYAALLAMADALGAQVAPRSVVFCLCDNNLASLAGYLGLLRRRAVPLLLNGALHAAALAQLLEDYRPAYLWLPQARAEGMAGTPLHRQDGYVLLRTGHAPYPLHAELALLMTTSGSTGSPRLVRQSYRNLDSNAAAICEYLGIGPDDRPITTLPMSYTYGLSIINSHLLQGCTILLSGRTLMEKGFWELLKSQQATTFGGVPYVYEMLRRLRFQRMDLPSLRYLTQAGGRLDPELSREFAALCRDKGVRYVTMYGQTEATARMAYLPAELAEAKAGSIGVAIPGGEFWLEDEHGQRIAAADSAGELVYRGANVALGYAAGHADLARGDDNGGVLRTGDLARRDGDGCYTIVGRKKRFLKLFGNRLNLDELDQLVAELGYAAVCAGEDDHVRIYTTDSAHHGAIKQHVVERTGLPPSGFEVIFIEQIPRNDAGKILYSALR
jgi:acyl-coenzyme A synthetase/AMP-(fatty) acid ligase